MADSLAAFIRFLDKEKHMTKNTLDSYRRDVAAFLDYVRGAELSDVAVEKKTVDQYLSSLKKAGRAQSTVKRNLASIKAYYRYLSENGDMASNPCETVKLPRTRKKLPQVLSASDVERLLELPQNTDAKGFRDKAMLELLYASGLRVSELLSLNLTDVNLDIGFVHCGGRDSHERIIPIGTLCREALRGYLRYGRPELSRSNEEEALFLNMHGSRMTRQGFWKLLKQYAKNAEIEAPITPHTLRHSFAAHLLENGADIHSIQSMLGHADVASTKVYVQLVNSTLKDVYSKAHPRA